MSNRVVVGVTSQLTGSSSYNARDSHTCFVTLKGVIYTFSGEPKAGTSAYSDVWTYTIATGTNANQPQKLMWL